MTRKNAKNAMVSVSKWSSHNDEKYNATNNKFCGLKTWSLGWSEEMFFVKLQILAGRDGEMLFKNIGV